MDLIQLMNKGRVPESSSTTRRKKTTKTSVSVVRGVGLSCIHIGFWYSFMVFSHVKKVKGDAR